MRMPNADADADVDADAADTADHCHLPILQLMRMLILILLMLQVTAIYRLFSVLDRANTGKLNPDIKSLVANPTQKAAELLNEVEAFMADKDDSGEVSFAEFLEQFRLHEATPDSEDINKLTHEFKERALDAFIK